MKQSNMQETKSIDGLLPLYNRCNRRDGRRVCRIETMILDGTPKEEYWNGIRRLVRSVRSDVAINQWQRVADEVYRIVYES